MQSKVLDAGLAYRHLNAYVCAAMIAGELEDASLLCLCGLWKAAC